MTETAKTHSELCVIAERIKAAMASCVESFCMEVADSIENEIGRGLTEQERQQISETASGLLVAQDQLEVERQQREAAEAELAALRGEQEPVAWIKCGEVTTEPTTADVWIREMNEGYGYDVEVLCKRQPKPVVVLKSGYLHKSEVIKAIEGAGVVVKFETAGIVAGHNDKVDITCWSCRRFITFQQHAEADGFCPHCSVEIELDDKDGE